MRELARRVGTGLREPDQTRAGGAWTVTDVPTDTIRELPVVFEDGACRPVS